MLSSAQSQGTPLPPSSRKDFGNLNDSSKARIQRAGENDPKQSGNNKMYDDDEPLLLSSATQGGGARALHFNPIPEDEAEGGISYGRSAVEVGGSGVEVVVSSEAALVSADRNHQNYVVLLRVKAPAFAQRSVSKVAASVLDPSCRAPIDLVTVLDVSGSMSSAAKLHMLKRAMRLLISSLGSSDRLSIVAFSAGAKRLLPLVRMSRQGQRSARQIVDRLIVCGGGGGSGGDNGVQGDCRCIGHALRKATKVLEDRRERNPVATIMLLSDSHQEHKRGKEGSCGSSPGLREEEADKEKHLRNPIPSSTETVATRFAHLEIPIECSTELSGCGGVNQVEDVFSKCVSGLVSLLLQDVHLQLNFPSAFVSSIYSYGTAAAGGGGGGEGCVSLPLCQGQGGNGAISVRLGDFYADEKRELLVELRLPASAPQQQRSDLLLYKCCYRDPTSRELVLCQERSIVLPPLRQISPSAASSRELRNLFITTRALVESRRLADHNDLETAAHLLSTARSLLIQSNSAPSHHQKYVTSLELRLAEIQRRHRRQQLPSSSSMPRPSDQLTPTSAWRAAEQLAKVAILRKSMSRVGDLHGFENARF